MDRKELNKEIVRLAHAGKTAKDIVSELGAPKSTVCTAERYPAIISPSIPRMEADHRSDFTRTNKMLPQ